MVLNVLFKLLKLLDKLSLASLSKTVVITVITESIEEISSSALFLSGKTCLFTSSFKPFSISEIRVSPAEQNKFELPYIIFTAFVSHYICIVYFRNRISRKLKILI